MTKWGAKFKKLAVFLAAYGISACIGHFWLFQLEPHELVGLVISGIILGFSMVSDSLKEANARIQQLEASNMDIHEMIGDIRRKIRR